MTGSILHQTPVFVLSNTRRKLPILASADSFHSFADLPTRTPLQCREVLKPHLAGKSVRANASNVGGSNENDNHGPTTDINKLPVSIALVLSGCALIFSIIAFGKGAPSTLFAKSGFTAAFTLIFVSEIGDKTFFIAALLAMQYEKGLVILGSMGALSLMSVLSVIIGRIFNSVPAQFQTTLPIGEYAAVSLLMFFGLKAIKDAWDLPSSSAKNGEKNSNELDEFAEAEELVKEKASKQLKNPFEIIWKSFSLVFFAEWGDRSMLATIALGAAQSPWGVASGAIAGHLLATCIAAVGGAFLANYISEKLVGYLGGVLFLLFAVATFLGGFLRNPKQLSPPAIRVNVEKKSIAIRVNVLLVHCELVD